MGHACQRVADLAVQVAQPPGLGTDGILHALRLALCDM